MKTELDSDSVGIVTVAQALHWFDIDKFYSSLKRVGKNGGIIAVCGYDMHKINSQIDKITEA
ncbi:MAG TPA: methyltransferase domain-containing protein [Nitrososphaeraceae archaeon]|nr:methyltransferase domain-containing protein [Nitrososphaeraceae archaeon]